MGVKNNMDEKTCLNCFFIYKSYLARCEVCINCNCWTKNLFLGNIKQYLYNLQKEYGIIRQNSNDEITFNNKILTRQKIKVYPAGFYNSVTCAFTLVSSALRIIQKLKDHKQEIIFKVPEIDFSSLYPKEIKILKYPLTNTPLLISDYITNNLHHCNEQDKSIDTPDIEWISIDNSVPIKKNQEKFIIEINKTDSWMDEKLFKKLLPKRNYQIKSFFQYQDESYEKDISLQVQLALNNEKLLLKRVNENGVNIIYNTNKSKRYYFDNNGMYQFIFSTYFNDKILGSTVEGLWIFKESPNDKNIFIGEKVKY